MKLLKYLFMNKIKNNKPNCISYGMNEEFLIPNIDKLIEFRDISNFHSAIINTSFLKGGCSNVKE